MNRLQRELETVLSNYRVLEKRLEAEGIDLRSISQLSPLSTDTECAPPGVASCVAAHSRPTHAVSMHPPGESDAL